MAKETTGIGIGQGVISHRSGTAAGAPLSLRKIRCPYCSKMATPRRDDQGRHIATCGCGRTFRSSSF